MLPILKALSIGFFCLSSATVALASVWTETNTWNTSWEDRYSNWVKNSYHEEIFTSGNYKNIPTDCADAVYLSRAIFAFENKLPFVILDPTGGAQKISNRMGRWDGSNELTKFRKFAFYLGEMVDTKSLSRDSYPIAIQRQFVRAGTIWSRPRIKESNIFKMIFGGVTKEDPGHAEIVRDVTETGAIQLIGSTVPSAVRKLISTSSMVFMPVETSTGLRKWYTPELYGRPEAELPGFSLEQFKLGASQRSGSNEGGDYNQDGPRSISEWTKEVQSRLQLRPENRDEALYRAGANLCNLVQARVETIHASEKKRLSLNGQCMNASDYDSYSTPSRDKRIMATIVEMVSLGGGLGFTTRGRVGKITKYLENCPPVTISATQTLSLPDLAKAYANELVSSDPNDSFAARWGMAAKDQSHRCPVY